MSSNKRPSRSSSKTRKSNVTGPISKTPSLDFMAELSTEIENSFNTPGLSYAVKSANDSLHDVGLQPDDSEMLCDPMNDRVPARTEDITTEPPALFTKETFQIQDDDESDMESEIDSGIPFLLPKTVEEANYVLGLHCSCGHIVVDSINRNKYYLVMKTPCTKENKEPEQTVVDQSVCIEEEVEPVYTESSLDKHLRGVKRTREDYAELPANAKKVIKEFAEGRTPNFALMDSETMMQCADYI